MDVVLSYELTNDEDLHLFGKYYKYFRELPKRENACKVRRRNEDDECHISNSTVTVQSSPQPNNESKYHVNNSPTATSNKIKNNYQYFSDSELCKMPVDFENSSLKNSFSMSSLQPSNRVSLEQSSQSTNYSTPVLPNRAYNSLTHKLRKRNPEHDSWRNSWGHEDQKDESWTSFESNYQYLMNNNLIDSCKEVKNDLSISTSHDWTFSRFKQQFLDLDAWLNSIQKTIYANDENQAVSNIRLNQLEKMKRKNYQRKNFVSQSSRLVTLYHEHKDEILDYVSQLNTKWDQLAQTISPKGNVGSDCYNLSIDVRCELHCLSKWIRAMEKKVEPLNFRRKWSLTQIKQKAKEHELVQRDVESHRKTVLSVVKLCEKHSQSKAGPQVDGTLADVKCDSSLKKAQHWERRWHLLYLKCLEWQYYIEEQINNLSLENFDDTGAESDDEQPASKHRRLNSYMQNSNIQLSSVDKGEDSDANDLMDTGDSVLMTATHEATVQTDIDMLESEQRNTPPLLQRQTPTDIPLNDNFRDALRKLPMEKLSKMIPPDFAMFNTTDVSSPNVGVYYIPHEDTDPEQEPKTEKTSGDEVKSGEESSDDEWTYKNLENGSVDLDMSGNEPSLNDEKPTPNTIDSSEDLRNQSKKVLDLEKPEPASIRRLVDKAHELVQTTPKRAMVRKKSTSTSVKARHNEQVREWLRKCQQNGDYSTVTSVGNSCDASSEYTTEDDDQYERHSSCDQTLTLIGSSQDNGIDISPVSEFVSIVEPPKVMLRNKSTSKKSRPLSTSELTHMSHYKLSPLQWVSESALHKMLMPLKDAQSALSSSTIEECTTHTLAGSGCNLNSLRRRKLKHRRRSTLGRKGHSGSADSLSALSYHDATGRRFYRSPVRLTSYYLKLDSFSEPAMMRQERLSSVERAIASDPANCAHNSTSGTETEEELANSKKCLVRKKLFSLPAFRLGPQHGTVTRGECNVALSAISAEEQLSSFSENAWDDYQERYVSEAYSEEPVDLDQVKKLTEFGDDYRNYIDSHSDCTSSFTRRSHSMFGRNQLMTGDESSAADSDSDLEDVRKLLQRSHDQLCCSQQLFAKQTAKPISCFRLLESDFADLRNQCRENVRCLRVLLERIEDDGQLFTTTDIKSLLDEWENLEGKTDEWERKCSLQRDIIELRKKLSEISSNMSNIAYHIEDRNQLENHIKIVRAELDSVSDKKALINEYKVKAYQLSNDSKHSSLSLKDDINELNRIWEETHQKILRQLTTLEHASLTWSNFDKHMQQLQMVLRDDHTALNVLNQALKKDDGIADVASAMQNIVKCLPEKHHDGSLKVNNNSMADHIDTMSSFFMSTLNVEGSFSDSGISDSGSEHDIWDREKRVVLLRKLARYLEAVLAPGSDALLNIMKKIDEAEEEIRELQQTYRTIKTGYLEKSERNLQQCEKTKTNNFRKESKTSQETSPDDPGSDPGKGRSVFWRVLRASLPFHMAIVVLLCIACLLEPNCCDTINNLNLSLLPQLRYVSGPPPT